jgi:WD40 repeat protein
MARHRGRLAILANLILAIGSASGQMGDERHGEPLPEGARYRLGAKRLGFPAWDELLVASPDGRYLAFVSHNRHLLVYEHATGREVSRIPLSKGRDTLVRFTPDGKSVVLNHDDQLTLFDVATGKPRASLGPAVRSAAFSADGKALTTVRRGVKAGSLAVRRGGLDGAWASEWTLEARSASEDDDFHLAAWLSPDSEMLAALESDRNDPQSPKQTVRVCKARTGAELVRWTIARPPVEELVFGPDGRHVAAGSRDGRVRVWETVTGKERASWKTAGGDAEYSRFFVGFAGTGDTLVSTGAGGLASWEWRTGKRLQEFPGTKGPFAVIAAGKGLAAQGPKATLRLLDLATGEAMPSAGPVNALAFSPNGRTLAWAQDSAIMLGATATGKVRRRWSAGAGDVVALAFAPDATRLASAGNDDRVRVWSVADGRQLHALEHQGAQRLLFTPDGRRIVTSGNQPPQSCVWDATSGMRIEHYPGWTIASAGGNVVAFLDSRAKVVYPWDAVSGKLLPAVQGYRPSVTQRFGTGVMDSGGVSPSVSADGRIVLVSGDGEIKPAKRGLPRMSAIYLREAATGRLLKPTLSGFDYLLFQATIAPDGRHLAALRSDGQLALVRIGTDNNVRPFGPVEWQLAGGMVFTPDGRTLAIASHGALQFWEVATGGTIVRRAAPLDRLRDLVVSADGRVLMTLGTDGMVLAWDLTRLAAATDPGSLTPAALATLWDDLANLDAVSGRRAVETLIADPAPALSLLRKSMPPATMPERRKVARLIADLDSDEYDVRQQTMRELEHFGPLAAAALNQALADNPGLEARRRIEALLEKIERAGLTRDEVRLVRAVQVLESIESADARALLVDLAKGAPGAVVTHEARAALQRMGTR